MIWTTSYRTRFAENVPLATGEYDFVALIGGFDIAAIPNMTLWQKLLKADAPSAAYRLQFFSDETSENELFALVPRSEANNWSVSQDHWWKELIQPDVPERAFAAIIDGSIAKLVMVGQPTEDAWDSFLAALASVNQDQVQ